MRLGLKHQDFRRARAAMQSRSKAVRAGFAGLERVGADRDESERAMGSVRGAGGRGYARPEAPRTGSCSWLTGRDVVCGRFGEPIWVSGWF